LAASLRTLATNPALRQKMADLAPVRVASAFAPDKVYAGYESVLAG